jgi:hypothetical protein
LRCGEEHFPFPWNKTIAQQDGDDRGGEEERANDGVGDCGNDNGRHRLGIVGGDDARPECNNAEEDLQADDGVEPEASARDFGNLGEAAAQRGSGPNHHAEDDGSAEDVGLEREVAVTKASADEYLKKDEEGVERDDGVDGREGVVSVLRKIPHVPVTGQKGDADKQHKDDFRGAGVKDGKPVVEELEDGEPSENALENHATESSKAEIANRGTLIVAPQENGQDDDEKTQGGGDEAMRMFESDAAHHRRVEGAVGKRPIGDSESGVFGGNEGTGGEEHGRPSDNEQGELVYTWMIGGFHEFRAPISKCIL